MTSKKYTQEQWETMTLPATQDKIFHDLRSSVVRFLDTAPEKQLIFRASAILGILRHYFEQQLAREDGDAYDTATAEEVLIGLSAARKRMRTDQDVENRLAEIMAAPPMTDEELDKKVEGWRRLDALLKANGLEHWWD